MDSDGKIILTLVLSVLVFLLVLIVGAMLMDHKQKAMCVEAGMQIISGSCVQKFAP